MRNKSTSPKPPKRSKSKSTVAHTTKEWKAYEHVLPSMKTINNHKHVFAIHHEQDAAAAVYQIQPGMKVTLQYNFSLQDRWGLANADIDFLRQAQISTKTNFLCL